MCALSWRFKDRRGVIYGFDVHYAHVVRYDVDFAHAKWARVVGFARYFRLVREQGGFLERFFASLVGTTELSAAMVMRISASAEQRQSVEPSCTLYTSRIATVNKPIRLQAQRSYTSKRRKMEPRAGFAPAACCLRGSRSAGLSYRGTPLSLFELRAMFLNINRAGWDVESVYYGLAA
jgi:hypothetical protein